MIAVAIRALPAPYPRRAVSAPLTPPFRVAAFVFVVEVVVEAHWLSLSRASHLCRRIAHRLGVSYVWRCVSPGVIQSRRVSRLL